MYNMQSTFLFYHVTLHPVLYSNKKVNISDRKTWLLDFIKIDRILVRFYFWDFLTSLEFEWFSL